MDRGIFESLFEKWNGFLGGEKVGIVKIVFIEKDVYNVMFEKLLRRLLGLFGLFVKENYFKVWVGMILGISVWEVMLELFNKWRNFLNIEKEWLK